MRRISRLHEKERHMSQGHIAANPFTPSFGRVPPILIGRSRLIADMTRAFDSKGDDPRLCTVFTGQRGTGKTAPYEHLLLRMLK